MYPYYTVARGALQVPVYENAVAAAGDVFVAPAFTPTGCPFPSALSFFRELAHTGDSVPLYAGRDIVKFQSEAATWLTATHTTFMVHAAAAAAVIMILLPQLFRGYHSLYGVTVSHHITHHQAA